MSRSSGFSISCTCVLFFTSAMTATSYGSSSTGYTVTDLGLGYATLSNSGANETLTSPDGKSVYSFPITDNSITDPYSSMILKLPALVNPYANVPSTGVDPSRDFHYFYVEYGGGPTFLNANGIAATTVMQGISGHINAAGSSVDTFQRLPDGTFTQTAIGSVAGSPNNSDTGGIIARALFLNNQNQLLSETSTLNSSFPTFILTDLNSGIATDLQSLLPNWHIDQPMLSDNGQLLVYGDNYATGFKPHAFLLTPDGVSSAPLATPEPTALVTLAFAGLGLVVRRRWKSR